MENTLRNEVDSIKNIYIQKCVIQILEQLPDYFWEIPASSSGKYHPSYVLGEGGLIRHTKAAVKIAVCLFDIYDFDEYNQDLIIASLILHDGLKCGLPKQRHTVFDHPMVMYDFIMDMYKNNMNSVVNAIADGIASHMGQWNTKKNIVLPLPVSEREKFIHMCDFLASRKCIEINFEA